MVENKKIDFISITQNINTKSAEGRMFMHMLMVFAEYERDLITTRTKDTIERYQKSIERKGYFINRDGKKKKSLGRPKGSKDKEQRRKSGYYRRWEGKKTTPLN